MSYRKFNKKARKKDKSIDAFVSTNVYLPKATANILKDLAATRKLPVSRLVAIAVDNELDVEPSFNYPVKLPDTNYREYAYAKEAGALMDWLSRFPHGVSLDTIMLCRRDILGEEEHNTARPVVLEALRELVEKEIAEFFAPAKMSRNKAYERVRIRDENLSKSRKKFKRLEGESLKHTRRIKDDEIERGE